PIWQKFKNAGKSAGIVTTVMAAHATPAGFCVCNKSRNGEAAISAEYLDLGIDVIMGGGLESFSPDLRKDKRDLFKDYSNKGYAVFKDRQSFNSYKPTNSPLLGIFHENSFPYALDTASDKGLYEKVP